MKKTAGVLTRVYVKDLDDPEFWIGVTEIDKGVFYQMPFRFHEIPEGVTKIGDYAYEECANLETVTLPSTLKKIGNQAFASCSSLKNINLPEGLTDIGNWAFKGCSSLEGITIPYGVAKIGRQTFLGCSSLKHVVIPETVSRILDGAFSGCSSLESVIIPNNVTTIYQDTFSECSSLKRVTIPESVTEIGMGAFAECSSLKNITIPESVKKIGANAFSGCSSLKSVTIPNNVIAISVGAFSNCSSLKSITISSGVTEINSFTFENCTSLENIIIPESVTEIGMGAFAKCSSLKNITIPESVKKIDARAFNYCTSLENITIPSGVKKIEEKTFWGCDSLKSVTIPEGVTQIAGNAFQGCSSLKSITIPESVAEIDFNAFWKCNCLVNLTVDGKSFSVHSTLFNAFGFEEIKDMARKGVDFKAYNTLFKKLGSVEELVENFKGFVKICKVLGVFEPKNITTNVDGKQIPVGEVAYTLLQNALITNKVLNFADLNHKLQNLSNIEFCRPFLKFMSKKSNCHDMLNDVENMSKIVTWFRTRQNLPPLEKTVQPVGYYHPTIEENRYKVYRYSLGQNGIHKDRWNEPTVKYIKEELEEKKYAGVSPDKKHIAEALASVACYRDQKFFDKASEIEDERRKLVKQGKLSNHILKSALKQDIIQALDGYRARTQKMGNEIFENCEQACETNIEIANKLFTYEMLSKDSEEIYIMGANTSCCAKLFGAGAGAQRAAILHPDVQPLVIRDVRGEIVAMGIVYVNREKGYAVVNDFEVNERYSGEDSIRREIYNKAMEGVDAFVRAYNREDSTRKPITKVHCGLTINWAAINDFIRENPRGEILEAVDFGEYQYNGRGRYSGDWNREQRVIWAQEDQGHEQ